MVEAVGNRNNIRLNDQSGDMTIEVDEDLTTSGCMRRSIDSERGGHSSDSLRAPREYARQNNNENKPLLSLEGDHFTASMLLI